MAYDATLLAGLALLETRGGEATIKGPNGEDSYNLFNVKDFSGKGFRAHDKAEGSRDAYRVYASRADSERDLVDLLQRRYPKAHAALGAGDAHGFATGLKEGGYATDPGYVGKLLAVIGKVRGKPVEAAAFDDSPEALARLTGKPKDVSADAAVAALGTSLAGAAALKATQNPDALFEAEQERENEARLSNDTGVRDAFRTALGDPRVMSYDLLDRLTGESDRGPDVPGWSWSEQRATMTKGMSDAERGYMDEWAERGPQYADRARAQVQLMRDADKTYGRAGALATFAASLGAGSLDAPGWVIGMGVGKLGTLARTGIRAAGIARAPVAGAAALAASAGEQVSAQLLYEAMNDASGRHSTAEHYMMAAAFATLPFAMTARGTYRGAAEHAIQVEAQRWGDSIPERPAHETHEATAQRQAAEIRRDFDPAPEHADQVMPRELRQVIEDDAVGRTQVRPDAQPAKAATLPDIERPLPALAEQSHTEALPVAEVHEHFDFPEIQDPGLRTGEQKLDALIEDLTAKHRAGEYGDTSARISTLYTEEGFDHTGATQAQAARLDRLTAEAAQAVNDGKPRDLTAEHYWGTADGKPVSVYWTLDEMGTAFGDAAERRGALRTAEKSSTLREFLRAYATGGNANDRGQRLVAQHLLDRLGADAALDGVRVNIHAALQTGLTGPQGRIATPAGPLGAGVDVAGRSVHDIVGSMGSWAYGTGLHEAVHALTMSQLRVALDQPAKASPAVRAAVGTLTDVLTRLRQDFPEWRSATGGVAYAAKNESELVAMFFDNAGVQQHLSGMPASKSFGGRLSSAWAEVMDAVRKLLGIDAKGSATARDEVAWAMDVLLDRRGGGAVSADGVPLAGWPGVARRMDAGAVAAGTAPEVAAGTTNPLRLSAARKNFAGGLFQHAKDYVARNPIDRAKLKVLTEKIGSRSDGLVLAASQNPIMQMVASLVTETTTGAAGRKSTAAIRKAMVEQKIIGNSVVDFEAHLTSWRRANGIPWYDDLTRGNARRAFSREVYDEILRRRNGGMPSPDAAIRSGADAAEALFTRALNEQKRSRTLGSDYLPSDSVGYIPQALDGRKLANATTADIDALADHLAQHWHQQLQWDQKFSADFARYYINRARARAMETKGLELAAEASDAVQAIRDTLDAMGDVSNMDPQAVSAVLKAKAALSEKGLGQTRRRLDVALDATLPNGKRVLDFYDDNVMGLARRYANRTAGTVALTDAGIHGSVGARYLRDAITETAKVEGAHATLPELDAYDRVMGELLGTPIKGEVINRHASNLRLFVGLQRLGSLAFAQVSETMNMLHHLGLSATLKGVASLPRMMGEVGRIKRGAPTGNHILTSLELWSGDIGSEQYRMVMPLDAPDGRVGTYAEDPGLIGRLLTSASHVQQKVSFFRGIMAAQHRMVAEQITMRAAALIRDAEVDASGRVTFKGGNVEALRDMGFTEELVGLMHAHLPAVAQWDGAGRMTGFDITKLPNPVAAESFVQAVHRGVTQIIQGTFVGEKTKWMHNDYLKLLGQLRTFGVTATEKQWHRTAMIHGSGAKGYAYVAGMLVAQTALVLPLHLARVQLNAAGREDADKYIERNLSPYALVRAAMNYGSLSGMMGDALDLTTGLAGGWSEDVGELVGGRQGPRSSSVTSGIPVLGSADQMAKTLQGQGSLATGLKQLPLSNLPYVTPFINALREP